VEATPVPPGMAVVDPGIRTAGRVMAVGHVHLPAAHAHKVAVRVPMRAGPGRRMAIPGNKAALATLEAGQADRVGGAVVTLVVVTDSVARGAATQPGEPPTQVSFRRIAAARDAVARVAWVVVSRGAAPGRPAPRADSQADDRGGASDAERTDLPAAIAHQMSGVLVGSADQHTQAPARQSGSLIRLRSPENAHPPRAKGFVRQTGEWEAIELLGIRWRLIILRRLGIRRA